MSSIAQLASVLARAKELKQDVYEGVMQSLWFYLDGDVDNEVRARAMDCMSLIGMSNHLKLDLPADMYSFITAVSAGKEYVSPHATKFITSLLHIQREQKSVVSDEFS
jgi:hypothetical protein